MTTNNYQSNYYHVFKYVRPVLAKMMLFIIILTSASLPLAHFVFRITTYFNEYTINSHTLFIHASSLFCPTIESEWNTMSDLSFCVLLHFTKCYICKSDFMGQILVILELTTLYDLHV